MSKRRLRKEVEDALAEQDVILAQAAEAIKRVKRAVRPFLDEYEVANGTFKGDEERRDVE